MSVSKSERIEIKPTCARTTTGNPRQRAHERMEARIGHSISEDIRRSPRRYRISPSGKRLSRRKRLLLFVSNVGEVNPCGYLACQRRNVRKAPFHEIYQTSELFAELRDVSLLEGKCGPCEFRNACGGCRARAYAAFGSYLAAEPHCTYLPRAVTDITL